LAFARLAESGKLNHAHRERLVHKFQVGKNSIDVLTGITNPARWPELTSSRVRSAVSALSETHDFVILDCGFNLEEDEEISSDLFAPRRNQATIACLKVSDVIVAVSGPDVVSIARYIHALDGLQTIVEDAPILHVVNRIVRSGGLAGAGQTVRNTLHRFAGLDDVHLVDDDVRGFNAALVSASPIQLSAPRSPVVKQLHGLAQAIIEARCDVTAVGGQRVTEPAAG
jgi:MinD-like ATPase involved in chromosome partitioning or flagellar assembly